MSEDPDLEAEERAIYAIIALAASPVVIGVLLDGAEIDAGGTLSLIVVACAIAGLVARIRAVAPCRLPRARVHDRRQR